MPRGGGGRGGGGSPKTSGAKTSGARTSAAPTPPPHAQRPPPPAPAHHPPAPQAPASGGMMSGLMDSMASGMATGVGMSMGGRLVDSIFGGRKTEVVHRHEGGPPEVASPAHALPVNLPPTAPPMRATGPCSSQEEDYRRCINGPDSAQCTFYYDAWNACKQTL